MVWGLKISKSGEDVKTAADKDLSLSSELSVLKISQIFSETHTSTTSGGSQETQQAHNLGYVPAFICIIRGVGDSTGNDYGTSVGSSWYESSTDAGAEVYVDDTNVYFTSGIAGPPTGGEDTTFTFKVFILGNQIN